MNKTPIPPVNTLPCLFAMFIQEYKLSPCETKSDQTWRRASGSKVVGRVNIFAKYITDLSLLINSLNEYSVCEKHYNQIIMTNNILEKLKAEYTSTPSSSEENQQKKLKLTIDNDAQGQAKDYTNLLLELEEVKKKLIDFEYQKAQYSEIIIENKQRIIELELLNESLLSENNKLSEAMKSFTSLAQASRIDYIKKKLSSKEQMGVTHLIPVTADEEEKQSTESSMSKKELLSVIQTLLGSLNEANHPWFKGIKSKSKDELLSILQQVKDLYNGNDNNEAEDMI